MHKKVTKCDVLFIGGPLDWQIKHIAIPEKLSILHEGVVHRYYRRMVTNEDLPIIGETDLLVTYIHRSQRKEIKMPKRFLCFLTRWFDALDDESTRKRAVTYAYGMANAWHEFKVNLKKVAGKYERRSFRDGRS